MSISKQRCLCFFILLFTLSLFSCQIQARESKFFNKVSRSETSQITPVNNNNNDKVPISAAAVEEVKEHGYGLYGYQEPAHYPPTATNMPIKTTPAAATTTSTSATPTPTPISTMQEENEDLSNDDADFDDEEFEMTDSDLNRNNENNAHYNHNYNGYGNQNLLQSNNYRTHERQGMSDTRYLENGKYYHSLESEDNHNRYNTIPDNNNNNAMYNHNNNNAAQYNHNHNNNALYNQNNNGYENQNLLQSNNNNENYRTQRQGMSDTRYLENGKYYHNLESEDNHNKYNTIANNNNKNDYVNQVQDHNNNHYNNEMYGAERQGMSDTRYMAKGKYFYDLQSENRFNGEQGRGLSHSSYHEEEDQGTEEAGIGANNNANNKRPNEYDSIEEYEREEEQKAARKYGYAP